MQDTTLLFLIKRDEKTKAVKEICLAMKKRSFGKGFWNGVGGKLVGNETLEEALRRESKEEIDVVPGPMNKVAELTFYFEHKPEWNQKVHTFFTESWTGEPKESEEMLPQWFAVDDIPFNSMWPDDIFWLPNALAGKLQRGSFHFAESGAIVQQELFIVEAL